MSRSSERSSQYRESAALSKLRSALIREAADSLGLARVLLFQLYGFFLRRIELEIGEDFSLSRKEAGGPNAAKIKSPEVMLSSFVSASSSL